MRANYLQKTINSLKPSEKKAMDEMYFNRWDNELCTVQITMIKEMACALGDMGFTSEQILGFIAGYQRFYRQNSRFTTQEQLTAFLDKRLANIFGDGGFPEDYLQSFRDIGRNSYGKH